MELVRVQSYGKPAFPSIAEVHHRPELLKQMPRRWTKNSAVLGAVVRLAGASGAVTLLAGGCLPTVTAGARSLPQVHLTEAEARKVIIDEARKAGIEFKEGGPAIPGATVEIFDLKGKAKQEPLKADGYDAERRLGFVFVSDEDAKRWGPHRPDGPSFPSRIWGDIVADEIKDAKADKAFGAFHEPGAFGGHSDADNARGLEKDREKLRQQVRDFVKWLKSQGVI